jgi:hypothetical protein
VSWTFEAVDGTNLQSFRVTIRSQHAWLPITTTVTSAITPSNQPPARISTQGQYQSPRGCVGTLLSVVNVLHAAQVHVMFRARMRNAQHGAGVESLETALFQEREIPWDEIAFASIHFALERYLADRREQVEHIHFHDIERRAH